MDVKVLDWHNDLQQTQEALQKKTEEVESLKEKVEG
jgi:hypothetical protein